MKLSEILKDWPEKKESEHINCYQFDDNFCFQHQDCFDEEVEGMHPLSKQGFNTALTSCDREIDKEALWKLIVSRSVYHNFNSDKDNFITVPLNDLTDLIISTMPTWLRKVGKNE